MARQGLHVVLSCSERSALPPAPTSDFPPPTSMLTHLHPCPCPHPLPLLANTQSHSSEVPSDDVALFLLANSEFAMGSVNEPVPLRDFRVRNLPVLDPLPALCGLHIATYMLCDLAGRPIDRPLLVRHREKLDE
ncbi:hypothetical protein BGW80DRAFT_442593 [Lactifluus volemus]|nr:hypothetical protein BGW80DRAFT_442593 [Lactifluus volemus]